ncbi:MAG: chorismate synthase, partial [Spirochaetales bacterium]|nr:chorismate synthase [Spirochaetales bacterium]
LLRFLNTNTKSKDYSNLVNHPRPSHADYVANLKYDGFNDYRGGGHFSARLTLGIVAAGVVAAGCVAAGASAAAGCSAAGCSATVATGCGVARTAAT